MANITYKCPECGAEIGWDGAAGCFKCIYCDGEFTAEQIHSINGEDLNNTEEITQPEELSEEEIDLFGMETDDGTEGTKLIKYKCPHCQAEMITEAATAATICVYCGQPVVLTGQIVNDFAPKWVVPFEKTKEEAMAKFKEFMHKPLTPKDFEAQVTVDKVQGIYIPFWLFSGKLEFDGTYSCKQCVKEVKHTVKVNDSTIVKFKRDWDDYSSTRKGYGAFNDIPVDASSKTDDEAMQSIEPFDLSKKIAFNPAYLSGYLAERYDETSDVELPKIKDKIELTIHDKIVDEINFDRVSTSNFTTNLNIDEPEYALLPTWLLYCSYNNKKYLFAMNGQTGKFIGNLPIDKIKAGLIMLGTFIASAVLCWGILGNYI